MGVLLRRRLLINGEEPIPTTFFYISNHDVNPTAFTEVLCPVFHTYIYSGTTNAYTYWREFLGTTWASGETPFLDFRKIYDENEGHNVIVCTVNGVTHGVHESNSSGAAYTFFDPDASGYDTIRLEGTAAPKYYTTLPLTTPSGDDEVPPEDIEPIDEETGGGEEPGGGGDEPGGGEETGGEGEEPGSEESVSEEELSDE